MKDFTISKKIWYLGLKMTRLEQMILSTEKMDHFRRVSGVMSFANIADKIIAEKVSKDMSEKTSQDTVWKYKERSITTLFSETTSQYFDETRQKLKIWEKGCHFHHGGLVQGL